MEFAEEAGRSLGYAAGGDLEPIVKKMGGEIRFHSNPDGSPDAITVTGPGAFQILLSGMSSARRGRFTIAHELGHYVLHSKMGAHHPMTVHRDESGRLEWEANWFAAGFLMPSEPFTAAIREGFGNAALATKFGVSEAAVAIRRETLGV